MAFRIAAPRKDGREPGLFLGMAGRSARPRRNAPTGQREAGESLLGAGDPVGGRLANPDSARWRRACRTDPECSASPDCRTGPWAGRPRAELYLAENWNLCSPGRSSRVSVAAGKPLRSVEVWSCRGGAAGFRPSRALALRPARSPASYRVLRILSLWRSSQTRARSCLGRATGGERPAGSVSGTSPSS